jgi:hypothetical protein
MKAGRKLVYWDTAVWLAWLQNERHWPETVLAGIEDVILQLENGKLLLLTSSITRSEVFEGRLSPKQKILWNAITSLLNSPRLRLVCEELRMGVDEGQNPSGHGAG